MYFLRVPEARSQNKCVSRSYSLRKCQGRLHPCFFQFMVLQHSLACGCISPISACFHVTISFLLYVCSVACAIGFSKQNEVYTLKPLGKAILAPSSACPWCSALALCGITHHTQRCPSTVPPLPLCVSPNKQSLLI